MKSHRNEAVYLLARLLGMLVSLTLMLGFLALAGGLFMQGKPVHALACLVALEIICSLRRIGSALDKANEL